MTGTRHRTSTDYDSRLHFRLSLQSGSAAMLLDIVPDVLEAERTALEVAAMVVTVRNAAGAESAIAAAP